MCLKIMRILSLFLLIIISQKLLAQRSSKHKLAFSYRAGYAVEIYDESLNVFNRNFENQFSISNGFDVNMLSNIYKNFSIKYGLGIGMFDVKYSRKDVVFGDMIDYRSKWIYDGNRSADVVKSYQSLNVFLPLGLEYQLSCFEKSGFIFSVNNRLSYLLNSRVKTKFEYEDGETSKEVKTIDTDYYNKVNDFLGGEIAIYKRAKTGVFQFGIGAEFMLLKYSDKFFTNADLNLYYAKLSYVMDFRN